MVRIPNYTTKSTKYTKSTKKIIVAEQDH